jgi:hypothetical protein
MKASEFRKLIREEVTKVLNEATNKAFALVIDEDGNFLKQDLASYFEETAGYEEPTKLSAAKAAKFPTDYDAWANAPQLAKAENAKWVKAVSALTPSCDFYDVLGDGGENAFIAAVPKGTSPNDYNTGGEAGGETSNSVSLNPNSLYTVIVHPKFITGPYEGFKNNAKAMAMAYVKQDGHVAKKLDNDTYIHYDKDTYSFKSIGVIGKPKSNPEFWEAVSTGNKALAYKLATDMKKMAK